MPTDLNTNHHLEGTVASRQMRNLATCSLAVVSLLCSCGDLAPVTSASAEHCRAELTFEQQQTQLTPSQRQLIADFASFAFLQHRQSMESSPNPTSTKQALVLARQNAVVDQLSQYEPRGLQVFAGFQPQDAPQQHENITINVCSKRL